MNAYGALLVTKGPLLSLISPHAHFPELCESHSCVWHTQGYMLVPLVLKRGKSASRAGESGQKNAQKNIFGWLTGKFCKNMNFLAVRFFAYLFLGQMTHFPTL